jgi:hypothetical protein
LSKLLQPPGKDFSGAKCVASKQLFKAADLRKRSTPSNAAISSC